MLLVKLDHSRDRDEDDWGFVRELLLVVAMLLWCAVWFVGGWFVLKSEYRDLVRHRTHAERVKQ